MAKPKSKTIKSLKEYTEFLQFQRRKSAGALWFRGCGDFKNHTLKCSLYRHSKIKTANGLSELESNILLRFRQRGNPFDPPELPAPWEPLFFMQHYGVPTRLLDWTENPFTALFFAVTSAPKDKKGKFESDAAVWVLDPTTWNRHALGSRFKRDILSTIDDEIKGYIWRLVTYHV